MRLVTHYVFTFAATLPLAPILYHFGLAGELGLRADSYRVLQVVFATVCLWLSLCVNFLVDRAGHVRRSVGGWASIPVRAWRTHSVYTAPLWGGLVGALTSTAYVALHYGFDLQHTLLLARPLGLTASLTLLGVYASYTHLFLDSLTEAGVYTGRHRRVALAHFKYNNPPLNFTVILASLLLAYYAWVHPYI